MKEPNVMIPQRRSISIPAAYFSIVAALFMFVRIDGEPDSMPRKTPRQPLSAIKLMASSSELLQRKYENQLNGYFFLIISRQISLKRGKGTLKVSSIKTTFLMLPSSWIESSSFSITGRLVNVNVPARKG